MNKHDAIYKLYPNVVSIRGDEAFDAQENPVQYDEAAVQAEMEANPVVRVDLADIVRQQQAIIQQLQADMEALKGAK